MGRYNVTWRQSVIQVGFQTVLKQIYNIKKICCYYFSYINLIKIKCKNL